MLKKFSTTVLFILLVISCARQGTPSGGPKDETPPKYLSSNPDTLSLNVPVDLTEIKINFDEYLILKDHQTQLVVSPPFEKSANYLAGLIGPNTKKIILIHLSEDNNNPKLAVATLKSTLKENGIDFENIIVSSQNERTELVTI